MALNVKKTIGNFAEDVKSLGGSAATWIQDPLDAQKLTALAKSAGTVTAGMTGVPQAIQGLSPELEKLTQQAKDAGRISPVATVGNTQEQAFSEQGINDFLAQQAAAREIALTGSQTASQQQLAQAIQALQAQSQGAVGGLANLQQALAARQGNIDAQGVQLQVGAEDPAVLAQQQQLSDLLFARAQGQGGPSPAELLLQAQNERALRNQLALAASMSGRSLPAAQRQILAQQAVGGQELAQQAAILRAQEQQQAQGQSAALLEAMRQAGQGQAGLSLQAQTAQGQQNLARQTAIEEALRAREATQSQLAQAAAQGTLGAANTAFTAQAGQVSQTQAERAAQAAADAQAKEAERQRLADERAAAILAQNQANIAAQQAKAQMTGAILQSAGAVGASVAGKA